jgi:hypothetical protein
MLQVTYLEEQPHFMIGNIFAYECGRIRKTTRASGGAATAIAAFIFRTMDMELIENKWQKY